MYQLGECCIYFEDFLYREFRHLCGWLIMRTLFIALLHSLERVCFLYSRSIARSFGVSCLPTTPTVQLLARCPESSCSKSWRAFLNRCVAPSIPFFSRFDVSMDDDYWRIRRTRLNTIIYEILFQRIQLPYNASY